MCPVPTPRTARGRTGIRAEGIAHDYLESLGWTILGRNVVVGRGELDLVARDPERPDDLVIVEVRGVRTGRFGAPEESVGARKLARLQAAAMALRSSTWAVEHRMGRVRSMRIDVIAVDLEVMPGSRSPSPVVRHIRGVTLD